MHRFSGGHPDWPCISVRAGLFRLFRSRVVVVIVCMCLYVCVYVGDLKGRRRRRHLGQSHRNGQLADQIDIMSMFRPSSRSSLCNMSCRDRSFAYVSSSTLTRFVSIQLISDSSGTSLEGSTTLVSRFSSLSKTGSSRANCPFILTGFRSDDSPVM